MLLAVAEGLGTHAEELAALIAPESGLSLKDTRHEVARAATSCGSPRSRPAR